MSYASRLRSTMRLTRTRLRPTGTTWRTGCMALWLLALATLGVPAQAGVIRVAVAANFAQTAKHLAFDFSAQTGHTAELVLGASGQLATQIQLGAPFDVFLSGDTQRPSQLAAQGLAISATRFTYATGQLALWSATPGLVDPQGAILRQSPSPALRLAVANPKLAPYGAAAIAVLQAMGLQDQWQANWVIGANIGQTHQFVASGNATLGFVAMSQVMRNGQFVAGSGWLVPRHLYAPIAQDAVLLRRAEHNPAALAWMAFLRSAAAATTIRAAGYLR